MTTDKNGNESKTIERVKSALDDQEVDQGWPRQTGLAEGKVWLGDGQ